MIKIHDAILYTGDCIEVMRDLPDQSVNCCITSPPYFGLRDYGNDAQIGLEQTPDEYVAKLVRVFREVKRLLRDGGTVWLVLGDSYTPLNRGERARPRCETSTSIQAKHAYADLPTRRNSIIAISDAGFKYKDLLGIPWRVAFALQADGWYLRQDIIWHKPNPMPESVTDRCTKAHEYIFLLSKSSRYYYDAEAIKERAMPDFTLRDRETTKLNNTPGRTRMGGLVKNDYNTRNRRSVWTVTTKPYPDAHFATFPPDLITPCVMAGCPAGGTVLDPFSGSGTTGEVALSQGRKYIGIELNPEYQELAIERITPHARQTRMFI